MWILATINLLGLMLGWMRNETVMYVLFGVSFMAFFHKYALISWEVIYEHLMGEERREDTMIANEFTCFFVMACIYYGLFDKFGPLCIVVSALQCFIFQFISLIKRSSDKDRALTIVFMVEFLCTIVYLR